MVYLQAFFCVQDIALSAFERENELRLRTVKWRRKIKLIEISSSHIICIPERAGRPCATKSGHLVR